MKARNCFGKLTLGALIGIGIGYWIATDPKRRRKIGRFITDAENKVNDVKDGIVERYEGIKDMVRGGFGCDLPDDDLIDEIDIIVAEVTPEVDVEKKKK